MEDDFFDDDLFDILGMSFYGSGRKLTEGVTWCRLTNMPCIPLSSCDAYQKNGTCMYASNTETDDKPIDIKGDKRS